ncbi:ABC transporter ATP-binding protein [Telmatospirillum siberiense]|uniref:ABC transporter ATP-binding protein n=1 Tax=Telmatospirillum siberiense TaxID=382514 RepID=A0A2N3PPT3_9PROT|nr:ABC transporter ATP-binding protein [Telmatospirillum siberiense]PKU22397.1 ABC transporter ATP-binding protein [Telmatospirillum siberiense]
MSGSLLKVAGVTRRFGGLTALDGLDLDVGAGEILGLIGPNGSGKTTFFNVITGVFPPNAGSIHFGGHDITGFAPPAIYRAGIARTFQRSRLCLELSVLDNILIGNQLRLTRGFIFNLLRRRRFADQYRAFRAEAVDLLATFDPPLARRIEEPVAGMPMILRRRIEICRALISRPRLLLLDEPSAGMTHDETRHLMDDILEVRRRLGGELAIIIIEHEMGVIERITDRCAVLNFGQKICEGSYRAVAADPLVQQAYLGVE